MILVCRGPECGGLSNVRDRELPKLRKLKKPGKGDVVGYDIAAEALWKAQHQKCCYCEHRLHKSYNDVEHYRPKLRANRFPGSKADHGYFWLAFSWENLLFACPVCNRSAKNDLFPLAPGSTALRRGQAPPGKERPLLLDPGGRINPIVHIMFEYRVPKPGERTLSPGTLQWFARPRGRSPTGTATIAVCDMNHQELLELRGSHVDAHVKPKADALNEAIVANDIPHLRRAFAQAEGLLRPAVEYVALSYDALRHYVKDADLARFGLAWPAPREVGRPAQRRAAR
jgi:5-methylcytosine-specific restriction endonuclease McrA